MRKLSRIKTGFLAATLFFGLFLGFTGTAAQAQARDNDGPGFGRVQERNWRGGDHDRDDGNWRNGYRRGGWDRGDRRWDGRHWFNDKDRRVVTYYYKEYRPVYCTPGWRHDCVKRYPGRRFAVGQMLPAHVGWSYPPPYLARQLRPAPVGHYYAQVDSDVLLINAATKHIIDAVTILSAVD